MATELVHVGFGNLLVVDRVIGIVPPASAPTKRLVQEARNGGQLIDMTSGRRTNAVLVLDTGHLVLVAIAPEAISGRTGTGVVPRVCPGGEDS